MQEATMQASVWLVSWILLAATVGASALGNPNDATGATAEAAGSPVRLAGANGHDSVGGLMPLPLWPRGAVRAQEATPAPSWWRGARPCCGMMGHSNKARR
jgi:hypothetical protein